MDWDRASNLITLLEWLDNGSSLSKHKLLPGYMLNSKDFVERAPVQALCDFGYLRCGGPTEDGVSSPQFHLSDKTRRLLQIQEARRQAEVGPPRHFWIVVVNGEIFIDKGEDPPNLRDLVGEEWVDGDKTVITCHDPKYVRVADLRLALADGDPLFIADLNEIAEDFKYADAEVDAQ